MLVGEGEEFDRGVPASDNLGGGDGEALFDDAFGGEAIELGGEFLGV
jgi:hypothetical protein